MSTQDFRIDTLGIAGSGAMGRGIAQIAALAGLTVCLFDTNPKALAAARAYLSETFDKLVAKGKLKEADAHAALARVCDTQFASELFDCDAIVASWRRSSRISTSSANCSANSKPWSMRAAFWRRTRLRCRSPRSRQGARGPNASRASTSSTPFR